MRGQMDMEIAEGLLDLIAALEPLRPGADNALLCGKDLDHQDTLYYGGKVLAEGFGKRDYPTDPIGFIVQAPLAIRFLLARVKELESIIVDCDWARMNEVARRLGVPLMINRTLPTRSEHPDQQDDEIPW